MTRQTSRSLVEIIANAVGELPAALANPQLYLKLIYMVIAMPLGIVYFVVLIVGLSLGLGLLVIGVGIPILMALMALWWNIAAFERKLAIRLLGVEMPPMMSKRKLDEHNGMVQRFFAHMTSPVMWKSLGFLLAKMPVGIASFSFAVAASSLAVSLLFAPLTYEWWQVTFLGIHVDSLPEALLMLLAGLVVVPFVVMAINGVGELLSAFAAMMLSDPNAAADQKLKTEDLL